MKTPLSKNQIIFSMVAVMLSLLLAALDQTIVATALPKIVQDFGELSQISWVATSYMLASTVTVPVLGKLSDIYGRKWFFFAGIFVFLLGSVLCGISQNMTQLIIYRGIQGLGSGAIFVNSFALIGDLFTPAERGKWMGVLGSVFGLASVVGPLTGGFLTDNFTWRWVFFVNVPIGIVALAVTFFALPRIMHEVKDKTIDWIGAATLTIGLVALLFGFVWGGNEFAWNSWQIISLFIAAIIFIGGFIYFELKEEKAHESILPLSLFKNKTFAVGIPSIFLSSLALFSALIYIPLFAQDVINYSATNSGLVLTPMMLTWVVTSAIIGQVVSRSGKYKALVVFGTEIVTLGLFLLSQMTPLSNSLELIRDMIIIGVGMGISFPILNLAVQNAFPQSKLGVVTATAQLFRSLGGTIGTALMGSILNNRLNTRLASVQNDQFLQTAKQFHYNFPALTTNTIQGILAPATRHAIEQRLSQLPAAYQQSVTSQFENFANSLANALSKSITDIYVISTIIMLVGVVLIFFIPEIELRKTHHTSETAEEIGEQLGAQLGQEAAEDEILVEEENPVFTPKHIKKE